MIRAARQSLPQTEVLPGEITRILRAHGRTGENPIESLLPLVYGHLRQMAGRHFSAEDSAVTLQPTALISEVYLRMVDCDQLRFENRKQFYRFAGVIMRRILVDHARARQTAKRGTGKKPLPYSDDFILLSGERTLDLPTLIALDEALTQLAERDPRQCHIVEMRFFGGMQIDEVAEVLGISTTMVTREMRMAKAWLARALTRK